VSPGLHRVRLAAAALPARPSLDIATTSFCQWIVLMASQSSFFLGFGRDRSLKYNLPFALLGPAVNLPFAV